MQPLRPNQVVCQCNRCGQFVSTRDVSCPHCGQAFTGPTCHACHSRVIWPLGFYPTREHPTFTKESLLEGFVCRECGYRWKNIKECERCHMRQSTARVVERLLGNEFVERYYCDICLKSFLPGSTFQASES